MSLIYDTKVNKTKYLVDLENTGKAKQSTLLSMSSTAPSGTFQKGSKYYNSTTKLIYTAVDDNTWTGATTSTPEFGVIYIYSNNGTTTYYQWDGDNLVETDLEKYQLVSNISNDFTESSKNKYPSSYALYKGLGSVRPNAVTNSGANLPATTEYSLGDTFLNTTDKKLYIVKSDNYELNIGTNISSSGQHGSDSCSVDYQTGIVSNFIFSFNQYYANSFRYSYINRYFYNADYRWTDKKEYNVHFKLSSSPEDNNFYMIMTIRDQFGYSDYKNVQFCIKNQNLYIREFQNSAVSTITNEHKISDINLQDNIEYFLKINKYAEGVIDITLSSYSIDNVIENKTTETNISDTPSYYNQSTSIMYGAFYINSNQGNLFQNLGKAFNGQIYLLDSTGDLLKASGTLVWNSGESLIDLTQYADTTNGIMYFYANNQLFYSHVDFADIGGVPSDNTALNTVLNSKQDNLPDQTGNNGKVLSTDGTNLIWSTVSGGAPIIEYFTNISGVTFDPTPFILGTVNIIYKNGLLLQPTEDYTLNGNEITFVETLNNDNITIMKW